MTEATFTFRVDEDLKAAFTEAAKAQDRTGAQLMRDFMRDFISQQAERADYDRWFKAQVQQGLDEAGAGKLMSSEDIEAEFSAKRAATVRKIGGEAA